MVFGQPVLDMSYELKNSARERERERERRERERERERERGGGIAGNINAV